MKDGPSVSQMFEQTADKFGDRNCVIFEDKYWTYRQIEEGKFIEGYQFRFEDSIFSYVFVIPHPRF